MAAPSAFDKSDQSWWFLGKDDPSSMYAGFGYTADALELGAYIFDNKIASFTPENSDAAAILFARKGKMYEMVVNAAGRYVVYEDVRWSWHKIAEGTTSELVVDGSVNNDRDIDTGFCAKVCVPWSLIGGKPCRGEELRVHLRRFWKADSKEKPLSKVEDLQGENSDYPSEWLRVILK